MEQKDKECKKCGRVFGSVKCFDVDCPNNTPNITMNQENKELLLKDLCARLPYKVKASYHGAEEECECWDEVEGIVNDYVEIGQYSLPIEAVKPYLFPLSSMTEEQKKEYRYAISPALIASIEEVDEDENNFPSLISIAPDVVSVDWCNRNHFDYRGLIEKSLALDATNLNIY